MRGFPGSAGGGNFSFGFGMRGLAPDPKTLHAIAQRTGGKFYQAKTAGAVEAAYSQLGSKAGRRSGNVEVTSWFLIGAALLLVGAGGLSTFWSPRLP
jgi:Ca-activated chloride channel family protein